MNLPGFIGGTYVAQSAIVGAEECVNLFPEVEQVIGQAEPKVALYRDPGLRPFATAGNGPVRSLFAQDGRLFSASGPECYEVFYDATATLRGSIAAGNDTVSICSNGDGGFQLFIVAAGLGYIYNLVTNALAQIADADFPANASMGGVVDGYFLVNKRDTAQFFISALEDGTSWDPTDIFQKSHTSDRIRAMVIDHGLAWLFGSRTIEPWYDSGDGDTPFQPVPDVMIMEGILSPDAWTIIDNSIFWAAENTDGGRVAKQAVGFNPQRISTDAVEAAWASYGTVTDLTVWDYQRNAHPCIQFDFPTEGISWVYDTRTRFWHKRGYWNLAAGRFDAHLGRCHVYAFGKHLVGSRVNGAIYEQTPDVYDDAGNPQRWLRRAPALRKELKDAVHGRFWVDAEVGTTPLSTGQGADPRMMMRFSDTSTKTWSVERWRSTGAMGAYNQRIIWNKLGFARGPQGRVYELSGTDPVPIALHAAGVDVR